MKNRVRSWVVLGVLFAVYTVVTFALPTVKNGVLWLSYLFGVAAIFIQLYVLNVAFEKGQGVKSKFYGFPIANVGIIYMLVQLVLGLIFMMLASKVPVWIPVVLYTVLFGIAAVGFVSADAMRDEVERQEIRLKTDTACITTLHSLVCSLSGQCEDAIAQTALTKLAEKFRYSDPVSSPALKDIEAELESSVSKLQQIVAVGTAEEVAATCKAVSVLLAERNQMCRLNK